MRHTGGRIRDIGMPLVNIVISRHDDVWRELHVGRAGPMSLGEIISAEGICIRTGCAVVSRTRGGSTKDLDRRPSANHRGFPIIKYDVIYDSRETAAGASLDIRPLNGAVQIRSPKINSLITAGGLCMRIRNAIIDKLLHVFVRLSSGGALTNDTASDNWSIYILKRDYGLDSIGPEDGLPVNDAV